MNKVFYLTLTILLGIAISSCRDASFDPIAPFVSDFWVTGESPMVIANGRIQLHDDPHGGYKPLPATSAIIIAWEMPNDTSRSLYVYGGGTISKIGFDSYIFTVILRDTLPKFALFNKDTMNAMAAGHIFLTLSTTIADGDTLHYNSNWDNAYQMIGSMNEVAVIFTKGNAVLPAQNTKGPIPKGFSLLRATKQDQSRERVTEFEPADPFRTEVEVDDNGHDCQSKTPFWLQ
jgi:hypothetical protein